MEEPVYLGLMSGTSVDGLDIVATTFPSKNICKQIAERSCEYTVELKKLLAAVNDQTSTADLLSIERVFSEFCAEQISAFLKEHDSFSNNVAAIGMHGHTALHLPKRHVTYQLGDASWIAAHTNLPVAADFRRKDIGVGGEGAPLAPAFHQEFMNCGARSFAVVNIGGISNVSVIDNIMHKLEAGFDTGPGNTLLDIWCSEYKKTPYDKGGEWARSGEVHPPLLESLLSDDYFSLPAPKSTGKETFNVSWLYNHIERLKETIQPQDVQATLTELTARTICDAIGAFNQITSVYLCGGGAYNDLLCERVAALLPQCKVQSTNAFGIAPEWVEACAFAWLGKMRLSREAIDLTGITGAERPTILGGLYLP